MNRACRAAAVVFAAFACGACGPATPAVGAPGQDFDDDDPRAGHLIDPAKETHQPAADSTEKAAAPPQPAAAALAEGTISRRALDQVLAAGAGRLLVGVTLQPVFLESHFAGWQIVEFRPADPHLATAPLRVGDIVSSINSLPIARPSQVQSLFDELHRAEELVVEGIRSGEHFQLRYRIATE